MTDADLIEVLTQTLEDRRLSRGERRVLEKLVSEHADPAGRVQLRRAAFALARQAIEHPDSPEVLEWLEEIERLLDPDESPLIAVHSEALFSPWEDCTGRIAQMLRACQSAADICVYTITDNRITEAIEEIFRRGVAVRILSEFDKATDLGADVDALARAGVPTRLEMSPGLMHHKFMIADRSRLLTGSFNWTRGASEINYENLLITTDGKLIGRYQAAFDRIWDSLG